MNNLTIGKLAKAAEVNVETIRYYQRIGLIQEPPKPTQGYRYYDNVTVGHIQSIKRAQDLGFTLKEIKELLSLGEKNCIEARVIAEHKYAIIKARITDLQAIQKELQTLIASCTSNKDEVNPCAILDVLSRNQY